MFPSSFSRSRFDNMNFMQGFQEKEEKEKEGKRVISGRNQFENLLRVVEKKMADYITLAALLASGIVSIFILSPVYEAREY